MKINAQKLLNRLSELEEKHRSRAETDKLDYENGFADGIQQAKNEIVGLLDGKRWDN